MMQINVFSVLFIVGVLLNFLLKQYLEYVDYKSRVVQGCKVPESLQNYVNSSDLEKTCNYENEKYFFWRKEAFVNVLIELFTAVFLYSFFYSFSLKITTNACFCAYIFTFGTTFLNWLVAIPFNAYRQFKIEKKYGFNKMTKQIFIEDLVKETVLSVFLAAFLMLGAITLFKNFMKYWYIPLGSGYLLISLVIAFVYPVVIAPLFNKFTPLEEGSLKKRLEALLAKCGFKSSGVYVMDASRRSGHSNAYFTGFGKSKRIVLYDTLIDQLSEEEIEAVLAHELGHYKKHHVTKRLLVLIPLIFAGLWIMDLFIYNSKLYAAFGLPDQNLKIVEASSVARNVYAYTKYCGIVFLGVVFGGFAPFASLISNFFSRRDEFAADSFAKELCGTGVYLSEALIKLNKENLSEFTPPKIYSVFNYSHPPLMERLENLK